MRYITTSRRHFIKGLGLGIAALPTFSMGATALWAGTSKAKRKPNFVVIFIDDMGYGDIEPFGSKLNKTPELNRMADEGMKLTEMGAEMRVHDPYLEHWYELENQDEYPAPGHSWSRFFRNQDDLVNIRVQDDLAGALKGAEAVILAVPHEPYLDLDPDKIVEWAGGALAVIDCFGILDDGKIRRYFELGCEVKALGRGHIQRIKEDVRSKAK